MSVETELGDYIVAHATGLSFTPSQSTPNVTVFTGRRIPTSPDACCALIEYPGRRGVGAHTGGGQLAWEYPRVQVMVRNVQDGGAANARADAEVLYHLLQAVVNATLTGTFYLRIYPQQPPFELGPDGQDRPLFGFNIECQKRVSAN